MQNQKTAHKKTMSLNTTQQKQENENNIVLQRDDLMTSLTNDVTPTLRKANFIKPLLLNTTENQPLSRPPLTFAINPKKLYKLKGKIQFKGVKRPNDGWKTWVGNLEQNYQSIWKKNGIFNAIRGSTCRINLDIGLIMSLAQKWCCETNTFVLPWGECSVTLEDVMVLGGFSVLGGGSRCGYGNGSCEDVAMEADLEKCCVEIRRRNFGQLRNCGWISYFEGKGGELEHVALLVLWLSRYVFCTSSSLVDTDVFGLAIRLAKGTRIALAQPVLASIYRDLTLLKMRIVAQSNSGSKVQKSSLVLWSPLHLVQVWAWERFPALSPKPLLLVYGEPRISRWHDVHKLKIDSWRLDVDSSEEYFLWRPYGLCLNNWEFPKFYSDEEMWMVMNSDVDEDFLSFEMCLRVCELEGVNCVEQYLPHRVGMQFGMDQDIPDFFPGKCADNDIPFEGARCYIPPRLHEGDVTVKYLRWWKGVSTSSDEALRVPLQSQSSRPRKLKIVFKSMKSLLESSKSCNEAMELDSVGCKGISNEKVAPFERLASQNISSLVSEKESLRVRNLEHTAMEADEENGCNTITDERNNCMESHHAHISSVVVNDAVTVNELLSDSETGNSNHAPAKDENRRVVVEAGMNRVINSLDGDTDMQDVEEVVNVIENGCEDMQDIALETPQSTSFCREPALIVRGITSDVDGDSNMLVQEEVMKQVENASDDIEDIAVKSPQSTSICREPALVVRDITSELEDAKEMNESIHDAVTTIIDVEDETDEDLIESLCNELEQRISQLERTISTLMETMSQSKQ